MLKRNTALTTFGLSLAFLLAFLLVNLGKFDKKEEAVEAPLSKTKPAENLVADTKEKYPDAVELLDKRTQTSKTFLLNGESNKGQGYVVDATTVPIHFNKGGVWEEINTALVPTQGEWDFAMEKADYSFFAKKVLNSEKLVEFKVGEEYIRFAPNSLKYSGREGGEELISLPKAVSGEVQDNSIFWKKAFGEGSELFWQATPERLVKLLKIENFDNLPPPSAKIRP